MVKHTIKNNPAPASNSDNPMIKIHIKLQNGSSSEITIPPERFQITIDNIPQSMQNVKEILIKIVDERSETSNSIDNDTAIAMAITEKIIKQREHEMELAEVEMSSKEKLTEEFNSIISTYDIRFDQYGAIINDDVPEKVVDRFELIRDELEMREEVERRKRDR